jgi:hypothetical protein
MGLIIEFVGAFYGYLVHSTVIWYILLTFGTFCGHLVHLVYFSHVGMLNEEKSGNPECMYPILSFWPTYERL